MASRRIVVDTLKINYEGLVNINEFYHVMEKWFREKGYDKYEKRNFEHVYNNRRQIEIEWEPWKKITDYAKLVIRVIFLMTDIKDVTVEKDGHKIKMQHAKILITLHGYLETDYEHKWEGKPVLFFMRAIFDQFIYKINTDKWYGLVAQETDQLYQFMKSYLNINRY